MKFHLRTTPREPWGRLLAVALLGGSLYAQTAPAPASTPTPAEETEEEVVLLPTFRVSAEDADGWGATNTITGTRLVTPLRDVPLPINVITSEFIEDIGAVDFKEALQYEAGIVQDFVQSSNNFLFAPSGTGQAGAIARDNTTINIRGFNTRSQLRNGFRVDTLNDNINVDRLEVARGPQALLYGVAVLGGIVNILPDYPNPVASYRGGVTFGDPSFYRFEANATGPIIKGDKFSMNYRAVVSLQDWDGDQVNDFGDRERTFGGFMLDTKIGTHTDLFFDVEGYSAKVTGNGFQDVNDSNASNSYERRTNAFGELTANNIYGERAQVARDYFGLENDFRISGEDPYQEEDFVSYTATVTHRFGRFTSLNVGVNRQETKRSGLGIGGGGTTLTTSLPTNAAEAATYSDMTGQSVNNGLIIRNYIQGDGGNSATARPYKRINYNWNANESDIEVDQFRADLAHTFDLFGQQTVLIGYQGYRWHQDSISTTQVTNNFGLEAGLGSTSATAGLSSSAPFLNVPNGAIRYQGEKFRPFRLNAQTEWNAGYYAIYQGRFFDERLYLIGGYRRDRYMVRDLNYTYALRTGGTASNYGDWQQPANYDNFVPGSTTTFNNVGANAGSAANSAPGDVPRIEGYRFGGKTQVEESPTYGASFRLTDALSIYGVSASGVFPNRGQRDGGGNPLGAEMTKSAEIGLKFDLWKNKRGQPVVSGAMALFQVERENAVYNIFWAPQPRSNSRARPRGGWPANTFLDFETSQPVGYLLPTSYFTPQELTNPAVASALTRAVNGHILVLYNSLGPVGGTDPFRNAMERAANDVTSRTVLGQQTQGSGANAATVTNPTPSGTVTGLSANLSYSNRNSDTAYDDKTTGFETQLLFRPISSWQTTLSYTYLEQEVVGGFKFVDAPNSTEYDSWWRYMGYTTDEARAINNDESLADVSAGAIGQRTLDNPEHQIAMFSKYAFESDFLRGLDVGLGFTWSGERISEAAITNGLDNRAVANPTQRFRPNFEDRWVWNALLGYQVKLGKARLNLRLNVNNLFDEDEQIQTGTSTVDPDGTGPLGLTEVPTIARAYYNPRAFRLSASLDF